MIDSKDLISGNLVYYSDKDIIDDIISIGIPDLILIASNIQDINYEPIPLTEEILLSFGLEKLTDNWFQIKYFTDCREWVEEMVIQINMTSFRCGIFDNDCGGCSAMTAKTIKYVHTFQNIYKLFVGKDLDTSKILNK